MRKALVKGSILGALIVYIWMMISWMVIPWHCTTLKGFQNEEAVASMILQNTEKNGSGIYVLPNLCEMGQETQGQNTAEKAPYVFASIQREGRSFTSPAPYIISFVIHLLGALFITYLVMQTKGLTYWNRVGFVTLIGLTIGILAEMPNWNWWGFSFGYVILHVIDHVISWFLAGLAIAAVTKKTHALSS